MAEQLFSDDEEPFLDPEPSEELESGTQDSLDDDEEDEELSEPEIDNAQSTSRRSRRSRQRERYERQIAELEEQVGIVRQFRTDPQGTLQQVAQQLGYRLEPESKTSSTPSTDVPSDVMKIAEQAFADQPDLAFMAPALAKMSYAIAKQMVGPLESQNQVSQRSQRTAEYQQAVRALEEVTPDWRTHETDMQSRLEFLKSALSGGPLIHPEYGNVLNLLHGWATGENQAVTRAARRMSDAARNRVSTGSRQAPHVPDVQQQIKRAKSRQDKMKIAFNAALGELGLQ